jgi:hypothetical protein
MLTALIALGGIQTATLHPAFALDRPVLDAAYDLGREEAKKKMKFEEIVRKYCVDLGRVRAPGPGWTAPYAFILLPHVAQEINGWQDQHNYTDRAARDAAADESQKTLDPKDRHVWFVADLYAWPGINEYDNSINRAANERDVRDVKFVLLIDGDESHPLHPGAKPTETGATRYDGTVTIPEYRTVYGTSNTNASAVGSGGWARANATTTSTVNYVDFSVSGYSAYQATYRLMFSITDKDGKPLVTDKTKELTLIVVRENGEHRAKFRLANYTPPKAKS